MYIGTKRAKKIRTGHSHGFSCKIKLVSNIPIRPRNERIASPLIKAVVIQAILLISLPFSFMYGRYSIVRTPAPTRPPNPINPFKVLAIHEIRKSFGLVYQLLNNEA